VDLAVAQACFQNDIQPHGTLVRMKPSRTKKMKVGKKLKKAIEGKVKARLMAGFFRSIYVAFD
jgi:hypothetical protein